MYRTPYKKKRSGSTVQLNVSTPKDITSLNIAALQTEKQALVARIVEIDILISGCAPCVASAGKALYPEGIPS